MNETENQNPWKKNEQAKKNMSQAAIKKWASDLGKILKERLSRLTARKNAEGKQKKTHRGYFFSEKMQKHVAWYSSYELRALTILESDSTVTEYQTATYYEINGRSRVADIIVNKTNMKEIKPHDILVRNYTHVQEQIKDAKEFCDLNGYTYEIWSEKELGFNNCKELREWSDEFRKTLDGIDYPAIRKKKATERSQRYYNKWLKNDFVEFNCKFCHTEHKMLRLTYDRDVVGKEDWVCHMENAKRTGHLPKDHLRVNNPYAAEGKKQCRGCNEIKLIQGNFTWKSKPSEKNPTGTLSADCNACRTIIEKQKYHAKKAKSKSETPL